jgi:ribosomal 50S subunit-associated protein YjgA (DUF615 family)
MDLLLNQAATKKQTQFAEKLLREVDYDELLRKMLVRKIVGRKNAKIEDLTKVEASALIQGLIAIKTEEDDDLFDFED